MRAWVIGVLVVSLATSIYAQQKTIPSRQEAAAPKAKVVSAAAENLPVRRVVLYKDGVGYFEHSGSVRGTQDVHIDFTSGQLDDALASLTVLDLGGGRVSGVNFNSTAPFERRLGELRLPISERTTMAEFLNALRGTRLEVRSGTAGFSGKLLSVERKTRISGGTTLEVDVISLVTDAGELREVELSPGVSVQIADPELHGDINRYFTLLSSERQQDLRRMTLSSAGAGQRELFVSYISEVPVWKTTYRLVLSGSTGRKPLLQGWAIVDNTVGEDWNDVELSLVAGAPQSFIQQLSQPYYARRPVVPLPQQYERAPQTYEATLIGRPQLTGQVKDPSGGIVVGADVRVLDNNGSVVGTGTTDDNGEYRIADLPDGSYNLEFKKAGFSTFRMQGAEIRNGVGGNINAELKVGEASQTVEVTAQPGAELQTMSATTGTPNSRSLGSGGELGALLRAPKPGLTSPEDRFNSGAGGFGIGSGGGIAGGTFNAGLSSVPVEAEGQELGDLFEYKLKNRVTLKKNQSAMVPILQTDVGAEDVSVWGASLRSARPMRGVWLTNTSTETLDGGNFSVLQNEVFAGQGLLDAVKPGERRLLMYATDLGMQVHTLGISAPQRVTRVRIAHGTMIRTAALQSTMVYTIRNEDTSPRTLIIEHPAVAGWNLAADGPKPEETSAGNYRFRVSVAPKQTHTLTITTSRETESRFEISNLTGDQLTIFVRDGSIKPEVEQALRAVLDQKAKVEALNAEASKRDDQMSAIFDDQQRLRENLKVLKGSPEERALTQRYTQQLSDQETRLGTLRAEKAALEKQSQTATDELDKMIEALTFDVRI